ncbi:hypothetical protein HMI54_007196 [Coelomomyces lativittatus]|nr:hypothetical protein HMI54_007196 [Coelomomyces lativittatus]
MLPFPSSSSSTSPPKSSFPSFLYSHPTSIPSKSTSPTTTTTSNDEDTLTPTLTHPHGPHPTNPRSTTHPTTTTTTTTTPRPYPFVRSLIHWCSPIFWSVFLLHVLKTMVVYFVVLLKQEWQQYPLWPLVSPCTCTGLSLSLFTSKKGPKGGRSPVDVWKDTCVRYVRQPILYFKLHFHCLKQRMYLKCQQVDFHSVFVSWTSWMKQKSKFFL